MSAAPPDKLLFVSSHRRHPKVADRLVGALAAGRQISLYAFDRGEIEHPVYRDERIEISSMGPISDGAGLRRLRSLWHAYRMLRRQRSRVVNAGTLVIVNTLDLLVVSWLAGLGRAPLIYDVADIHPLQLGHSWMHRLVRRAERRALKQVKVLVVSSPWFYWDYYRRWLHWSGHALLIENKVAAIPILAETHRPGTARIAWNGILRCRRSAAVLLDCLTQSPGRLHLSLHGALGRLADLGQQLAHNPDCSYSGPYTQEVLTSLLAGASFVWGIDYAEGDNSRWLLPNRLYESLAAGVPLIAVRGTATAQIVEHYRIGPVLAECTPQAVLSAVLTRDDACYGEWITNVRALRSRAQRRDEWKSVFAGSGQWRSIDCLPAEPDVDCVLRASP